jgi:hypothetical protein
LLSGSPVFDPFSLLKKATRFIISSRVELRIAGIMAALTGPQEVVR